MIGKPATFHDDAIVSRSAAMAALGRQLNVIVIRPSTSSGTR